MGNFCYIPISGIDDVIADQINSLTGETSWNSFRVANLRGLYDESERIPLDVSDPAKAAEAIINYRAKLARGNIAGINDIFKGKKSLSSNLARIHKKLKEVFSSTERYNRVSMIATMFSDAIDYLKDEYPNLSRDAICRGITVNGKTVGGQSILFSIVYENLMSYKEEALEEGKIEEAEKYQKVLSNFSALASYARIRLRDTEGITLDEKLRYVDTTTSDSYAESEQTFEVEESKREAWQEENDKHSAFGSIGKEVRRFLGTITNGQDDLGFPIMVDPVNAHQTFSEILVGVTSERQMLEVLAVESGRVPWINDVLEELKSNSRLRTQFYVDFHKGLQLYSILGRITSKSKNGITHWFTKILNRESEKLLEQYLAKVRLERPKNSNSIYDSKGNVNWKNLKSFKEQVLKYFTNTDTSNAFKLAPFFERKENERGWSERVMSTQERWEVVEGLLNSLGLSMVDKHMDAKDVDNIAKIILKIVKDSVDKIASDDTIEENTRTDKKQTFLNFIKTERTSSSYTIQKGISDILKILDKRGRRLKFERRARYKDNKGKTTSYDSFVNPSYMSDVFGKIANFVKYNDKEGLRKYIETKFLSSSYFYDKRLQKGKEIDPDAILNQWVKELYLSTQGGNSSTLDSDNNFANNFSFERFLGEENGNVFENFTSKQHLIAVMEMYWSDTQVKASSQYAHYPVFILGDSGVAKFIKAKRYTKDEILEGMYKVFLQEVQRMKVANKVNKVLEEQGYKTIENFSNSTNTFSILTFLNEDKYMKMIDPKRYKDSVKEAIQAYMTDAVEKFKRQADALGILETKEVAEGDTKVTRYVNLNQNANPSNIDSVLEDFYWNSTFAMINQLQFFTIDPSFYKGTKDLQKRYKEIHAPGTILSLQAKDFDGKFYSEDGIERVIYFDDIEIPAAEDFIKALKDRGISEDIIKKYLKNTLTDGQGYRTLKSYRKVMGMAGKWTEEQEAAYKEILNLRSKYGPNDTISVEDLSRIAELSVVFQPIKPYMFTHERLAVNDSDELLIPVQHKYAEAVLIPELLPNGTLKDLAYYMDNEDNNIDMICSTKAVKVGNWGSIDISKVTTKDELEAALSSGRVHEFSYEDFRIQTNVPEHLNANQLFGTQVRKLIMAFLNMDDTKYSSYVGGKKVNIGGKGDRQYMVTLNGRNLVAFYNSLIIANILESFDNFSEQVSSTEDLSDILLQNIVANSRESLDNMLAYSLDDSGNFTMPLFEGGLEHDAAATLFSIFKKAVNKQRIRGGSAVQVSPFGINGYALDGNLKGIVDPDNPSNILYAECEVPFDLSYTDDKGNIISLRQEDWCDAEGNLILGDEILDESHPEYKKYLSYTDKDGNVRKPKIEEQYPGILSFVAYRIPTERDYSMINLQIKRFSPKTAGGTIKVPAQWTTIAGFDFDIDKLYFMMREFKFKEKRIYKTLSEETKRDIWNRVYEKYPNIESELRNYRDTKGTSNEALNSYWDLVVPSYDKEALFAEAAEELGITLGEYTIERIPMHEYNTDLSPLENSHAARNNMLIHLIQQRLMDPETFSQRYTPGGFANSSTSARIMRELLFGSTEGLVKDGKVNFEEIYQRAKDKDLDPEPNYNPTDIMTLITYNQQNQVAGKLIGIFANQNTNHAFASLMESFTLKSPIRFCGHSYNDLLHAPEGIDVNLNVAEFLAASVDAVKDPVLNFLNLNTLTADAGALLARIGYTTEEIGLLFNQPIIKDICEYAFNNNTTLEIATAHIVDEYSKVVGTTEAADKEIVLSKDMLAKNILNERVLREQGKDVRANASYSANQLVIAKLFESISAASKDVSRFVTSSKFTASNAVGSTFGDMYAQQMRVRDYIASADKGTLAFTARVTKEIGKTISDDATNLAKSNDEYLFDIRENPFGYEQAMYDMNRRVKNLLTKYFPYDTPMYQSMREMTAGLLKSGTLDADTINSLHRDFLAYMLSQRGNSLFNGEQPVVIDGETMTAREYYTERFSTRLYQTIVGNPSLKSYMILSDDFAEFSVNEETGQISLQLTNVGGLQSHQRDALKDSWEELSKDYPNIARDLFIYNFYKTGFSFSPFTFMNLAPTTVKQSIIVERTIDGNQVSYIDFLENVLQGKITVSIEDFVKQYILNHLDNNRLVFNPKGNILKELRKIYKKDKIIQRTFEIDASVADNRKIWTIGNDTNGNLRFRPCVIIDGVVYMAKGDTEAFNVSSGSKMTYERVFAQGETNRSLVFRASTEKSIDRGIITDTDLLSSGNTSIIPEVDNSGTFNRRQIIEEIAREYKAAADEAGMRDEMGELISKSDFIRSLEAESDEALQEKIEIIRKACRKNGILVLDSEGNLMQNC